MVDGTKKALIDFHTKTLNMYQLGLSAKRKELRQTPRADKTRRSQLKALIATAKTKIKTHKSLIKKAQNG